MVFNLGTPQNHGGEQQRELPSKQNCPANKHEDVGKWPVMAGCNGGIQVIIEYSQGLLSGATEGTSSLIVGSQS